MPLFEAHDLIYLVDRGALPGMPACASLEAFDHDHAVEHAILSGPGIYALFLDDALFYIGLYTGERGQPGTVLNRWRKHVIAQTLRAQQIFFNPGSLRSFLEVEGEVPDLFAATLPAGRATVLRPENRHEHALLAKRRYLTTFPKARFAAAHWDAFRPGNEDDMLGRITCGYERLTRPELAGLTHNQIKYDWLKPRETVLVDHFAPVCNMDAPAGGQPWAEVRDAILTQFEAPQPQLH